MPDPYDLIAQAYRDAADELGSLVFRRKRRERPQPREAKPPEYPFLDRVIAEPQPTQELPPVPSFSFRDYPPSPPVIAEPSPAPPSFGDFLRSLAAGAGGVAKAALVPKFGEEAAAQNRLIREMLKEMAQGLAEPAVLAAKEWAPWTSPAEKEASYARRAEIAQQTAQEPLNALFFAVPPAGMATGGLGAGIREVKAAVQAVKQPVAAAERYVGRAIETGGVSAGIPGPARVTLPRAAKEPEFLTLKGVDAELRRMDTAIKSGERIKADTTAMREARDELAVYRRNLLQSELTESQWDDLLRAEERLNELTAELDVFTAGPETGLIRPPASAKGGIGLWPTARLRMLAQHEGLNPAQADWWDAIDSVVVRELRGAHVPKTQTKAGLQRELASLKAEVRQLEMGAPAPAAQKAAPQVGGMQAGMGIGERAPQGQLLPEYVGAGERIPLAAPEQLAARQARAAEIARGQTQMPVAVAKESWQMTAGDYVRAYEPRAQRSPGGQRDMQARAVHRRLVEQALKEGKPVPPEVLASHQTRKAYGGPQPGELGVPPAEPVRPSAAQVAAGQAEMPITEPVRPAARPGVQPPIGKPTEAATTQLTTGQIRRVSDLGRMPELGAAQHIGPPKEVPGLVERAGYTNSLTHADVQEFYRKYGDFALRVEDTNGQRALMNASVFLREARNQAFTDRIQRVGVPFRSPFGQAPVDAVYADEDWMKALLPLGDELGARVPPRLTEPLEALPGTKFTNLSSVTPSQQEKFVGMAADNSVRKAIREFNIKEIVLEPPYKFSLSEQGNFNRRTRVISINADAENPTDTILHELGHAKLDAMPLEQKAELLDAIRTSTDPRIRGYLRGGDFEEAVADTILRPPAVTQKAGARPITAPPPVGAARAPAGAIPEVPPAQPLTRPVAEVRPLGEAPPLGAAAGAPPVQPPVRPAPPAGDLPPIEPILSRPRTLADMNREAKGMRAMTPEQRAAVMDVAKPIEGDIFYQARPFNEHAQNLLGPDTQFMKALRSVPGVKQAFGAWNPAAMARDNPVAMIGLRQGIFQEIEKARVRFATLRWWNDADDAFGFKRSGTAYGLRPARGVWKAAKVKPASASVERGKMFGTINDIIEHPERYALDDVQKRVLALADNALTQSVRDAQRAGVNVVELAEAYWPRSVIRGPKGEKGFAGIRRRVSGAKGYTHQRVFADVDDLVKAGFDVETDPRRVFASRLEAGIDTIAQANARTQIATLPGVEKPLERMARRFPEVLESAKQARAVRDAAKIVVRKAGVKATPEEVMALRQAEAGYITSMREVFAKKLEAGTPGYYELRLPSGRIAPQELVEDVGKFIDLPELRHAGIGKAARLTQEVSQLLRTSLTNVDMAAGYIQGQTLFYRNNIAWWKAQGHSVVSLIDDPAAYVAKNFDLIDEGVRAGAIVAPTEFLFAKQGIASIPLRIPYVGPALGSFNRAFEWFITAGQTELYKAARSGVAKNAGMDELVSLGSAIRKEVGTESYAILGIRPTQRTMEALSLFAARFFRANVGLLGQSFSRGPGGAEARKALGSLIAGGMAITIGINWALNKKLPNMTDPYAPDWMQFKLGQTYFNAFGPMYPYFRTLARMGVSLAELDPVKAATEAKRFLQSKESLPLRALDIAGQLIYYGSANVYGTKIERTWLSIAKGILSEFVTPISAQEIPSGIAEGRPESALEAIGLIGRPVRWASEWYKELEAYRDIPSNVETVKRLAKEEQARTGIYQPVVTREKYRRANPEVDAKLFIIGEVDSPWTRKAGVVSVRLMQELGIDIKEISSLEPKKDESPSRASLRRWYEKQLGVAKVPSPTGAADISGLTTASEKWLTVSSRMDQSTLLALESLWFLKTPLPAEAEQKLRRLFGSYPLGQTNFMTWVKQTLRQLQENAATELRPVTTTYPSPRPEFQYSRSPPDLTPVGVR